MGKIRLYELREASDLSSSPAFFVSNSINQQIKQNGEYKQRFEMLLEEIRQSFKRKLGGERGPEGGQQMEFEEYDL